MRYPGPMLILHGSGDPHVPVAAARAHHRLVQQSELRVIDGSHFLVFQRPQMLAQPLEGFLRQVNALAPQ
jgi:pimeloyl-ACP methyl ester carboxylesterase